MAGKTGTSQHHSDGWFIGYTPNLVAGVWVGGESPSVRFRDLSLGQGANMALPVFALFMKRLHADKAYAHIVNAKFPRPSQEVLDALNCANIRGAFSKPNTTTTTTETTTATASAENAAPSSPPQN